MKDYRMVHEDFYVLPWHVSVFCCGHSFSENSQIYKPDLELNTKTLVSFLDKINLKKINQFIIFF